MLRLRPRRRGDVVDLPVGHGRQSGKDFAEVSERIDAATAAGFDDRVDDGAAIAGSGFADEEPVLLPHSGGTDGILDAVVVDLEPAVGEEEEQAWPLAERVVDRPADGALREEAAPGLQSHESTLKPCEDRSARTGSCSVSVRPTAD